MSDQARFFFEHGGEMTAVHEGEELTLGSAPDSGLVITGDRVEPLTAVARVEEGDGAGGHRVVLESRAGENEAKVNGVMLSLGDLGPGADVKIGDLEFTVAGETGQLRLRGDAGDFPLNVGANLVGRAPEAGVLVDHPSVSRKHALVMVMPGGQAKIRDLGSSNGTHVGDRRLGRCELTHGDKVEIGGQQLVFLAAPTAPAASGAGDSPGNAVGNEDRTRVASVAPEAGAGSVAPTVIGASLDLPERADAAPEPAPEPPAPTFELVRSGEPPLTLKPGTTVIGREPSCDVPLSADEQVSRRHAEIEIQGPNATLRDLGSSNGTQLNGQPLRGEAILADGDVVGIGHTDITVAIARPVDPHGATVMAPGGLSIPPAPGQGGAGAAVGGGAGAGAVAGRGGRAGVGGESIRGVGAGGAGAAVASAAGAASAGSSNTGASNTGTSNAGSSNAGAGGLIVDRASARAILDLPPGAAPEAVRARYQELFSEFQIRLTNAPTPDLKKRYEARLEELRAAHAILMPEDAGLAGDLPAASPVDAPVGAPAAPPPPPGQPSAATDGAVPSKPVPPLPGAGAEADAAQVPAYAPASSDAVNPPGAASEEVEAASGGTRSKNSRPGLPKSTWVMAAAVVLLLLVIGVFGFLYSGAADVESGLRQDLTQRETDLVNMRERIPQAGRELETLVAGKAAQLENHELKICNLGAGEMRVEWLQATRVTEDGRFDSFNSAEHGWKTWQIAPGGTSKFNFVSGDRVLWDGTAVFFSVLFTYRGEEYFRSGPLTELGPDCYNIDLDQ